MVGQPPPPGSALPAPSPARACTRSRAHPPTPLQADHASDEEFTEATDGSEGEGSEDEDAGTDGGGAWAGQPASPDAPPAADDWQALVARAEQHMARSEYEKAVNEYSRLLQRSALAGGTGAGGATARARRAALLLGRAAAYDGLSRQLRSIPAAQSEARAIYAPDPCQLAALGLKDAEAALALAPDCDAAAAQLHKGRCLFLLERYDQAQAAYRAGLQAQPTHAGLQRSLGEVQAALAGGAGGGAEAAAAQEQEQQEQQEEQEGAGRRLRMSDDAECILCMKLLYEPGGL